MFYCHLQLNFMFFRSRHCSSMSQSLMRKPAPGSRDYRWRQGCRESRYPLQHITFNKATSLLDIHLSTLIPSTAKSSQQSFGRDLFGLVQPSNLTFLLCEHPPGAWSARSISLNPPESSSCENNKDTIHLGKVTSE